MPAEITMKAKLIIGIIKRELIFKGRLNSKGYETCQDQRSFF